MLYIIKFTVFVLLCLAVIPVLNRTVVTGDPAVNFGFLTADRAGEMLACKVAVFFTDRVGRL